MQRIHDTVSGEDSGLANAWDEVCVQVQQQESFYWAIYVAMLDGLIAGHLSRLDRATQTAIWLQTSAATEWDPDEEPQPPVDDQDVQDYLLNHYVLRAAADWYNPRIEQYIEGSIEHD